MARIERGLDAAAAALAEFLHAPPAASEVGDKGGGDPITVADHRVDGVLRALLPEAGEGWLSEETADDARRLDCHRVWIVDPLDGTREFVQGIPEWCVSIGVAENGIPVAGGILNPMTGERFVGAVGIGVRYGGAVATVCPGADLAGATVLASRSESRRGEWDRFRAAGFAVRATGSVAYKLALVAAGRAEATFTLTPKNEWDVAGGVALVVAAGGLAVTPTGEVPRFNRAGPLLPGLLAASPERVEALLAVVR